MVRRKRSAIGVRSMVGGVVNGVACNGDWATMSGGFVVGRCVVRGVGAFWVMIGVGWSVPNVGCDSGVVVM